MVAFHEGISTMDQRTVFPSGENAGELCSKESELIIPGAKSRAVSPGVRFPANALYSSTSSRLHDRMAKKVSSQIAVSLSIDFRVTGSLILLK